MRRPGESPSPGSLVVREGKQKAFVKVKVEVEDDRTERIDEGAWDGQYHLSVFAALLLPGETVDEAVNRLTLGARRVKFYRISSPERLDLEGFSMIASPPEPYHYDVVLGAEADEPVIERFERCFDEARRNPEWTP